MEDKIHPNDKECFKELRLAKNDIFNNKVVYCNYVGNVGWHSLRAEKQMDSLLNKFKMKYQNESSPCVVEENRNYHCYCDFMQEKINEKYGEKFIDSLLYIADDIYISKKLNEVYDYNQLHL